MKKRIGLQCLVALSLWLTSLSGAVQAQSEVLAPGVSFYRVTADQAERLDRAPLRYQILKGEPGQAEPYNLVYDSKQAETTPDLPFPELQARESYILRLYDLKEADPERKLEGVTLQEGGQEQVLDLTQGDYLIQEEYQHRYDVFDLPFTVETTGSVAVKVDLSLVEASPSNEAPADPAVAAETGQLTVTVADEASQAAIPGVEIFVDGQSIGLTDEQGQVTVEGLTLDTHQVNLGDQLPAEYQNLTLDQTIELLSPAPFSLEVTLPKNEVAQPAKVIVSLQDDTGQAVAGAEVEVAGATATTDDTGQVSFEGLTPETSYDVTLVSLPAQLDQAPVGQVIGSVQAQAGTAVQFDYHDLTTKPTDPVQTTPMVIQVLDDEGNGHSGLSVSVDETTTVLTDAEGRAYVEGLAVGSHQLELLDLPEGYQLVGEAVQQIEIPATAEGVQEVNFKLMVTPQASQAPEAPAELMLTVRVVDQFQTPVSGVELYLNDTAYVSDEAGFIQVDGLAANQVVTYQGGQLPDKVYFKEANGEISLGTDNVQYTLEVERRGSALILVVDQEGMPVTGAQVSLGDQTVTTNDAGEAEFTDLVMQEYDVALQAPASYVVAASPKPLDLTASAYAQVTLDLVKEATTRTLKLHVVDTDRQPVQDVEVQILDQVVTTNHQGQAQLEVNAEAADHLTYQIKSVPEGYELPQADAQALATEAVGEDLIATLIVDYEAAPAADQPVDVVVKDTNQEPVAGVTIQINQTQVVTNAQGVAHFDQVAPGTHQYQIIEVPESVQVEQSSGQVQVAPITQSQQQTVTATVTVERSRHSESAAASSIKSTAESSESSSTTTSSASGAVMDSYRILTDDQTGIQVGLNGVDANRAASLQVTSVHDLALPASLKGQEVERYQIQVYDGSANRVALTQVAEVIIPTREQIGRQAARVVRIRDQAIYNLVAAVKPKYLHFKTQELGDFAVLYPAQQTAAASSSAQSQASATVTKTKGIEKKEDLPKTGESSPAWLPGLAGVLILGGLAVLVLKSKRD